MNKILCGKCAKKQGKSLDERKVLATLLQEGSNVCACGRVLEVKRGILRLNERKK
jgi:hypothetical protein